MALWYQIGSQILAVVGSGNGLLPEATKPLP